MAAKLSIRPMVAGDADFIAENMRAADVLECDLIAGLSPREAVDLTVNRAVAAWSAQWYGVTACIFGINRRSLTSNVGVPWLLGTEDIADMGPAFLRASLPFKGRYVRAFPRMQNYVHAENAAAIGWLQWLGFDMDDPKPTGWAGADFIRFSWGMR